MKNFIEIKAIDFTTRGFGNINCRIVTSIVTTDDDGSNRSEKIGNTHIRPIDTVIKKGYRVGGTFLSDDVIGRGTMFFKLAYHHNDKPAFVAPTHCPYCESELSIEDRSGYGNHIYKCLNLECKNRVFKSLMSFFNMFDVPNRQAVIASERLLKIEKLKTMGDFFSMIGESEVRKIIGVIIGKNGEICHSDMVDKLYFGLTMQEAFKLTLVTEEVSNFACRSFKNIKSYSRVINILRQEKDFKRLAVILNLPHWTSHMNEREVKAHLDILNSVERWVKHNNEYCLDPNLVAVKAQEDAIREAERAERRRQLKADLS